MGVDGIDKADIFDEYFDDDKPKITNFEKIKAMDIDEMVEFFTQEYDSDFGDGYCIPRICYDCKLYPTCDKFKGNLKRWLQSEVRE